MEEYFPTAVSESSFQIGGMTMRVYHLDDGRRILNADDMAELFSVGMADATDDELRHLASVISGQAA